MDPILALGLACIIIPLLIILIGWIIATASEKTESLKCDYCDEKFTIRYFEGKGRRKGEKVYTQPKDFLAYEEHLESNHPEGWKKYREIKEKVTTLNLLESAVMTITTGASSKAEVFEDAMWGIVDPMYGLYRKSIGIGALGLRRMTPEEARETIKNLYSQHPEIVNEYLESVARNLDKFGLGEQIRLLLKSFKEERIEDPLKILKLRYAKGEISKEEYEEMKKTLET